MSRRVELDGIVHEFPDDATDADIEEALGGMTQAAPQQAAQHGGLYQDNPKWKQVVHDVAWDTLPAAGMTAGSIGGAALAGPTPVAPVVGAAGGGTGYAAGRKLAQGVDALIGFKTPPARQAQTRMGAAAQTARDIGTGMVLDAGGQALGAGIAAVGKRALTPMAESLYGRSMKIPPGSLRESGREQVLKTMVQDERLPLGNKTLSVMQRRIADTGSKIDQALEGLSQNGADISINDVTTSLNALKQSYANRPRPQDYYDAIDAVKDDFLNHSFVNGNGMISLSSANALKKGTYEEIQAYYTKALKPETGRVGIRNDVDAAAKANAARAIRDAIADHPDVPPELRKDMRRLAGLMNARKWVERAVNRGQNLDVVSLSGLMFGTLVDRGVPAAIAFRAAKSQPVMSRFALAVAKMGRGAAKGRGVGRALSAAGAVAMDNGENQ